MYASITSSRIDNNLRDLISIITNLCDTPESTLTEIIYALPTGIELLDGPIGPALDPVLDVWSFDKSEEQRSPFHRIGHLFRVYVGEAIEGELMHEFLRF